MLQKDFPLWVGVGGTPQSVANTAHLGLSMILGIIGGSAAQFAPLMDYERQVGQQAGWSPDRLKTGVDSYLHLATAVQMARDTFYPYHAHYFGELSEGRGQRMSLSRSEFDRATRRRRPTSSAVPSKSSISSSTSTGCSDTIGSWPRSTSGVFRSPKLPKPLNCWPPKWLQCCAR
jgi:alkanesulfonate monooxygenase SsuD/methylene tetrahydromethanopterin reductase-like flavin-dependent oxidoreductase (luciferase family)